MGQYIEGTMTEKTVFPHRVIPTILLTLAAAFCLHGWALPVASAQGRPAQQQPQKESQPAQNPSSAGYRFTAQPGDSLSYFVRRAIQLVAAASKKALSPAQALFAESNLVTQLGNRLLEIGEQVTVADADVTRWIEASSALTPSQQAAWQHYVTPGLFDITYIQPTRISSAATADNPKTPAPTPTPPQPEQSQNNPAPAPQPQQATPQPVPQPSPSPQPSPQLQAQPQPQPNSAPQAQNVETPSFDPQPSPQPEVPSFDPQPSPAPTNEGTPAEQQNLSGQQSQRNTEAANTQQDEGWYWWLIGIGVLAAMYFVLGGPMPGSPKTNQQTRNETTANSDSDREDQEA